MMSYVSHLLVCKFPSHPLSSHTYSNGQLILKKSLKNLSRIPQQNFIFSSSRSLLTIRNVDRSNQQNLNQIKLFLSNKNGYNNLQSFRLISSSQTHFLDQKSPNKNSKDQTNSSTNKQSPPKFDGNSNLPPNNSKGTSSLLRRSFLGLTLIVLIGSGIFITLNNSDENYLDALIKEYPSLAKLLPQKKLEHETTKEKGEQTLIIEESKQDPNQSVEQIETLIIEESEQDPNQPVEQIETLIIEGSEQDPNQSVEQIEEQAETIKEEKVIFLPEQMIIIEENKQDPNQSVEQIEEQAKSSKTEKDPNDTEKKDEEEDKYVEAVLENKIDFIPGLPPELENLKESENYKHFKELLELQEEVYKIHLARELKKKEEEVNALVEDLKLKFMAYLRRRLQQQKTKLEIDAEKKLTQMEQAYQQKVFLSIVDTLNFSGYVIDTVLNSIDQENHKIHVYRIDSLDVLQDNIQAFNTLLESEFQKMKENERIHHLSEALLPIVLCLNQTTRTSLSQELSSLNEAAKGDVLIETAIDSIPQRAKEKGIFSLQDLKILFDIISKNAYRAKFLPDKQNYGIGWEFYASLRSFLYFPEKHGSLSGDELSRAKYFLEQNDLRNALIELETLPIHSRKEIEEWRQLAREYLLVHQTLEITISQLLLNLKSLS